MSTRSSKNKPADVIVGKEEIEAQPTVNTKDTSTFTEHFLIEVVCLSSVLLLAGFFVSILSISPLLPAWRTYSTTVNSYIFVGIVLAAYTLFRIYFGVAFTLLKYMDRTNLPILGSASSNFILGAGRAFITLAFVCGIGGLYMFFPQSKVALYKLASDTMGDLPEVLSTSMNTEYKRVYERVWKMSGLFIGWFVCLFGFEIICRIVLYFGNALVHSIRKGLTEKTKTRRMEEFDEPEQEKGKSEATVILPQ